MRLDVEHPRGVGSSAIREEEGLRPGLVVRASDGRRLGRVVEVSPDALTVARRGLLGRRRLVLPRTEVRLLRGGEVELRHTGAEVARRQVPGASPRLELRGEEEVRLPLLQEEAVPHVHVRERGQVRVRKVVRTELRHVTVEVRREELVMEHLPVGGDTPPRGTSGPFEEEAHVFTLWQEEVEVVKRPVAYEEVRVTRGTHAERCCQRVPLRFEVARVEEEEERADASAPAPSS